MLDQCPGLHTARAVGVPHPPLGEIVVVCAVPAPGKQPTPETVRAFMKEHVSSYKLPRRTLFFEQADLELTANEKIRLEPLRKVVLARLAAEGAEIAGHHYENREDREAHHKSSGTETV